MQTQGNVQGSLAYLSYASVGRCSYHQNFKSNSVLFWFMWGMLEKVWMQNNKCGNIPHWKMWKSWITLNSWPLLLWVNWILMGYAKSSAGGCKSKAYRANWASTNWTNVIRERGLGALGVLGGLIWTSDIRLEPQRLWNSFLHPKRLAPIHLQPFWAERHYEHSLGSFSLLTTAELIGK